MRKLMMLALLSATAASPAAGQERSEASGPDTIVVTGIRAEQTRKALDDCIARGCPPAEEIAATVAHAETLFVDGDYADARRTTAQGIRRNKRHAAALPVEVSGLMRANARIAAHLGEGEVYQSSLLDMVDAMRAGMDTNDPRVLAGRIELADGFARMGRTRLASRDYCRIARIARDRGHRTVEGYALFRNAQLWSALAANDPAFTSAATEAAEMLTDSGVPEHAPFASAARLMGARLAARRGDMTQIDRIVADLRTQPPGQAPRLLYAEAIKLPESGNRMGNSGTVTQQLATGNFEDQWIDVSFYVSPEGRPTDVELLRTSDSFDGSWNDMVLKSIQSRRYAPIARPSGDPGTLRVERYTYTSRWTTVTGSRLRQREPMPRIEMLDLSVDVVQPVATQDLTNKAG